MTTLVQQILWRVLTSYGKCSHPAKRDTKTVLSVTPNLVETRPGGSGAGGGAHAIRAVAHAAVGRVAVGADLTVRCLLRAGRAAKKDTCAHLFPNPSTSSVPFADVFTCLSHSTWPF